VGLELPSRLEQLLRMQLVLAEHVAHMHYTLRLSSAVIDHPKIHLFFAPVEFLRLLLRLHKTLP
jgi:hypothetical protein